jgi:shikimate kinase
VGAGKSTLCRRLATARRDAQLVSSRVALVGSLERSEKPSRAALQVLGSRLDEETGGSWLRDAVIASGTGRVVIVDAVRTVDQIAAFRASARSTAHIHVTAPFAVLEERYGLRRTRAPEQELASYAELLANVTEAQVGRLAEQADLVLDTGTLNADEVAGRALDLINERMPYLRGRRA